MDEQPPYQPASDPFRHPYPGRPQSGLPLPEQQASGPIFAAGAAPLPIPGTTPLPVSATGALMPVTSIYPAAEPVIAQIGDIQVTSTTIRTPAGQFPLRGSRWEVTDQVMSQQKIPTWAVVLAIVLICPSGFLSLLFLLAKETVYRGVVQVQVSNGQFHYVSRIPVTEQIFVQHVYQQVNYVRSLSVM